MLDNVGLDGMGWMGWDGCGGVEWSGVKWSGVYGYSSFFFFFFLLERERDGMGWDEIGQDIEDLIGVSSTETMPVSPLGMNEWMNDFMT